MKIYLVSTILLSISASCCSQIITPGKYINKANNSYLEIDNNNNYYFSDIGDVHGLSMFSKGKAILKNVEVTFIPDSSYFFHLKVLKYYFDSTLKDDRKIILENLNNRLSGFEFSFDNGLSNSMIKFDSNYTITYKPTFPSFQDGSLTLKAILKDSIVILPRPLHNYIVSNTISFFDINEDDPENKRWNVLILKVNINKSMFAFTILPTCILDGKKLKEKRCPIYELSEQ